LAKVGLDLLFGEQGVSPVSIGIAQNVPDIQGKTKERPVLTGCGMLPMAANVFTRRQRENVIIGVAQGWYLGP
jgi:hypothetical protein